MRRVVWLSCSLWLMASLAACSGRREVPDARTVEPDVAVDAGVVDAEVDAALPDWGPIAVPAALATRPLDPAALGEWRGWLASELSARGTTGFVSAVVLGEAVVDAAAVGVASGEPTALDRAVPLGEVTRVLTSLLIAALIEEGHLAWSAPIGQLRPDWPTGGPTLAELACGCFGTIAVTGTPPSTPRHVFERLKAHRQDHDTLEAMPTALLVSAAGYLAGGAAPSVPIDPAAAYVDQVRRRVTGPLGMTATTIGPADKPGVVPIWAPDHGGWGSVADLGRLAVALLGEGRTPTGGRVVEGTAIAALLETFDGERGPATRGGLRVVERGAVTLRRVGGPVEGGSTWLVLAPGARLGWAVRVEGQPMGVERLLERAFDRLIALRYGLPTPL